MPGALTHSPADVLRHLLTDLGYGTLPSAAGTWPIGAEHEQDSPDSVITIYTTTGIQEGRAQVGGEIQEHHGIQVRVRSADEPGGYTKARALAIALDQSVYNNNVAISSSNYVVYAFTRTGDVLPLGDESPDSKRKLFVFNGLVSLIQTS